MWASLVEENARALDGGLCDRCRDASGRVSCMGSEACACPCHDGYGGAVLR